MDESFFSKTPDIIAQKILGDILVRIIGNKKLKARIVETEAYFGKDDPASRASKGDNKVSRMMKESPGKILIYNVHKYKMLNFVTGKKGEPSAVLIRALEPLNFDARTSGPGLLTKALELDDKFHGKSILKNKEFYIEQKKKKNIAIQKSFRIGVTKDLNEKFRYYIKGNNFVSRK